MTTLGLKAIRKPSLSATGPHQNTWALVLLITEFTALRSVPSMCPGHQRCSVNICQWTKGTHWMAEQGLLLTNGIEGQGRKALTFHVSLQGGFFFPLLYCKAKQRIKKNTQEEEKL